MALTGAKDITAEAEKAREAIPAKYLAPTGATLLSSFDKQQMDKAGMTADREGFLNPQELRNLAARLAKTETEEELRAALSGVLSGRLLEGFFKHRDEALQKAAKEDRKARQDMYYLALLQAQLDDLNRQIADYGVRLKTLDDLLLRIERGEVFEVGPDGKLIDKNVEFQVREYESRTKSRVDRHDIDAIKDALKREREHVEEKRRLAIEKKSDVEAQIEAEIDARPEEIQQKIRDISQEELSKFDATVPGSKFSFASEMDKEEEAGLSLKGEFQVAISSSDPSSTVKVPLQPLKLDDSIDDKPKSPVAFGGFANG